MKNMKYNLKITNEISDRMSIYAAVGWRRNITSCLVIRGMYIWFTILWRLTLTSKFAQTELVLPTQPVTCINRGRIHTKTFSLIFIFSVLHLLSRKVFQVTNLRQVDLCFYFFVRIRPSDQTSFTLLPHCRLFEQDIRQGLWNNCL